MKKRFYKYLILLLIIQQGFYLPAQDMKEVDSLQNLLKSTQNDTTKISLLIALSKQYQNYNSEKAFGYGQQALAISIQLNNPGKIALAHGRLCELFLDKGDYELASDHCVKSLKIYENLRDSMAIAWNYLNIGQIYYFKKNYNEALNYYNKSLILNQKFNNKKAICKISNDIGIIYTILKKYKEAIKYYNIVLKISEEMNNWQGVATAYANISLVYYEMGKIKLAIEYTEKAIKIDEKNGQKGNLLSSYSNLGELYIIAKKYKEANIALHKAMKIVKWTSNKVLIKSVYENFASLYEKQNDFKKAFEYEQLVFNIKDSIHNESKARQSMELTAKYESEKKELKIGSLEKDNALAEENLHREQNFKIYMLLFSSLIIVLAFVLFRRNSEKKKANSALSFAYQEIEEKNKDITDSINYSKRIQESSLSPKELKYRLFPDAFVLFKPKDIVSGDFYWFTEKDGKKLIAACDCTGHGVPGALMCMLGNNILNQIVNEKGITSPDEILNLLQVEICKALKPEEQSGTKDGMDIALVTFLTETEIEYAGAQRPLWIMAPPGLPPSFIVINSGEENQRTGHIDGSVGVNSSSLGRPGGAPSLIEIKGDKFSIGGLQSETERKFTKHKISVAKGDCVYLFSDGYADQFGGAEEKRFMSKRFKDILLANNNKPMLDQEIVLVKAMETWKGAREQVDDILVIGVRV